MFYIVIFSLFALYWFHNEGSWYLQVNLMYSWLCEGSIYLGERITYLSFAFEIVGSKFKKLDNVLLFNNL